VVKVGQNMAEVRSGAQRYCLRLFWGLQCYKILARMLFCSFLCQKSWS